MSNPEVVYAYNRWPNDEDFTCLSIAVKANEASYEGEYNWRVVHGLSDSASSKMTDAEAAKWSSLVVIPEGFASSISSYVNEQLGI